jgi:hypothetical protein
VSAQNRSRPQLTHELTHEHSKESQFEPDSFRCPKEGVGGSNPFVAAAGTIHDELGAGVLDVAFSSTE